MTLNRVLVALNRELVTLNRVLVTLNRELVTLNRELVTLNRERVTLNRGLMTVKKSIKKSIFGRVSLKIIGRGNTKQAKNRKTEKRPRSKTKQAKNTLLGARATVVKRLVGHWYSTEALVQ